MEEKTKNHHSNKHIRNSKSRTPLLHKPPPFHHAHTNPLLFPSSPHHSLNLLSTGIHSSYYYYYCFYSQFHNTLLLSLFILLLLRYSSPPPDQRFFNSIPKPLSLSPVVERKQKKQVSEHKAKSLNIKAGGSTEAAALVVAKRPDSGGQDGSVIYLLANHFLVKVDPSQKIYHYNVDISPHPSKEVARMIKQKLVETAGDSFSGTVPAFDGRQNIYSPVEFQEDRLEFFVNLPIQSCNTLKKSGGDLRVKQPQKKIDKLLGLA
ncbi:Protein argonaute 7 [Raphanus sativus]|nr:Protein argonaute 7 [Raphanus sativus]